MKTTTTTRVVFVSLVAVMGLGAAQPSDSHAQELVTIHMDSTAQTIRGFGAANIVGWRPDMTRNEIETAFGTGDGQLGFSILRVRIPPDENQWNVNLPTATRAHEMGVTLIASPWSPPASMKSNNNVVSGRLRDDMYDDYAAYLDDFNSYMADNGAPLYGLSVQNEPDVRVTYESCDWSPTEMLRFMRENASAINTRVIAPESFQFRRNMSDPLLNDAQALANLGILGGHIYGGGLAAYPLAREKGKEVWMTEHLVLETDLAANIGTGLEIQNVMKAGMSAYIWWYIVRYYGPISDGEQGPYAKGEVTKRGYVMSQFSRFIRPGAIRIHTTGPGGFSPVSVTAYREGEKLVVVAVNPAQSARDVTFSIQGDTAEGGPRYVTSSAQDVAHVEDVVVSENTLSTTLGPQSVSTFVLKATPLSRGEEPIPGRSHRLLPNYPNPLTASTSVGISLWQPDDVQVEVFDALGRKVATVASGRFPAGTHRFEFDAEGLPSGVYLYRLRAGSFVETRRMSVVR